MSACESNLVRFGDLAIELGLTNAELVTKSFKLGLRIITADIGNYELSEYEVNRLRESQVKCATVNFSKVVRREKKPHKTRNDAKSVDDELKTPQMFAEYYKKDVDEVMIFCNSYGFNIEHSEQLLTTKQISLLYRKLGNSNSLITENLALPLQSTIGDLLRKASEESHVSRSKQVSKAVISPKNKRISVLAKELNCEERILRWLIEAVRVPVIDGKQLKFEIRNEKLIRTSCDIWSQLPASKNTVDRMRLSKIAKRTSTSVEDLYEICNEFSIPILDKAFVAAQDGIYLQTLYVNKVPLNSCTVDATEIQIVDEIKEMNRDQYSNANYFRQNFTDHTFASSDFFQTNFSYSDISRADFSCCAIRESQMTRVVAIGTVFERTTIVDCSFEFANLKDANFFGASLQNVNFRKALFANTRWIDGRTINSVDDI